VFGFEEPNLSSDNWFKEITGFNEKNGNLAKITLDSYNEKRFDELC
jgi:hypothetical protein